MMILFLVWLRTEKLVDLCQDCVTYVNLAIISKFNLVITLCF